MSKREAPGEGVGLGVLRVDGGAPDVDGGGVLNGSHVCVMPLCRRILHDGGILHIWDLMVRPLGHETIDKLPAVSDPPNGGLAASDRGRCVAPRDKSLKANP